MTEENYGCYTDTHLMGQKVHWERIDHESGDDQFLWDLARICNVSTSRGITCQVLYELWCYVAIEPAHLVPNGGIITVEIHNRLMNVLNYLTMPEAQYLAKVK